MSVDFWHDLVLQYSDGIEYMDFEKEVNMNLNQLVGDLAEKHNFDLSKPGGSLWLTGSGGETLLLAIAPAGETRWYYALNVLDVDDPLTIYFDVHLQPVKSYGRVGRVDSMGHDAAIGKAIRKQGVNIAKVIGARDENNSLVRLADAMSGFIRDACLDKHPKARKIFDRAIAKGIIKLLE